MRTVKSQTGITLDKVSRSGTLLDKPLFKLITQGNLKDYNRKMVISSVYGQGVILLMSVIENGDLFLNEDFIRLVEDIFKNALKNGNHFSVLFLSKKNVDEVRFIYSRILSFPLRYYGFSTLVLVTIQLVSFRSFLAPTGAQDQSSVFISWIIKQTAS